MNAAIACVGKLKEPWQRDACAEYCKRLARYGSYSVREVEDLPEPARPTVGGNQAVMEKEGRALLKAIRPGEYAIALCVQGRARDSVELTDRLARLTQEGKKPVFVIGGSLGLSAEVLARADERLSLSNLTMPHALARIVLLEQLYRAEKILAGERYHK